MFAGDTAMRNRVIALIAFVAARVDHSIGKLAAKIEGANSRNEATK